MSNSCRRSYLVLTFAALTFAAFSASAQYDCGEVCDPYLSYCSDYCETCRWWRVDGSCGEYRPSTCGGRFGTGPCLRDGCTPNWVETSRITQGTYDGRSFDDCTHHVVQKVTLTDQNACNVNSNYYSYWYCDDHVDDTKSGCCYPSCCEGVGENGTQLSCNGVHYCS